MTNTPGSCSNRRRTVSALKPHLSATWATEKWRSIDAVWHGISRTGCDVTFIVIMVAFGIPQHVAEGKPNTGASLNALRARKWPPLLPSGPA